MSPDKKGQESFMSMLFFLPGGNQDRFGEGIVHF